MSYFLNRTFLLPLAKRFCLWLVLFCSSLSYAAASDEIKTYLLIPKNKSLNYFNALPADKEKEAKQKKAKTFTLSNFLKVFDSSSIISYKQMPSSSTVDAKIRVISFEENFFKEFNVFSIELKKVSTAKDGKNVIYENILPSSLHLKMSLEEQIAFHDFRERRDAKTIYFVINQTQLDRVTVDPFAKGLRNILEFEWAKSYKQDESIEAKTLNIAGIIVQLR